MQDGRLLGDLSAWRSYLKPSIREAINVRANFQKY
jgi:hypothetical protein